MPEAEGEIRIERSPVDVFDFLAAGENNMLWRPAVLDVAHVSGEGVGAVWSQDLRIPGGTRVAGDYEITEYERPLRLAFRAIAGPARPEGRFELKPVEGGTQVSFSLWWKPKGLAKLLAGPVQKGMESEVGNLERLKAVLEKR